MKHLNNYLLVLGALTALSSFASTTNSEEVIFNSLRDEGAFVERRHSSPPELRGTGEFKLLSLQCQSNSHNQPLGFECSFVDEHRPNEKVHFSGANAEAIYTALVNEGVPQFKIPFTGGRRILVTASMLRCSKAGFKESTISYSCHLMKRLVEPSRL